MSGLAAGVLPRFSRARSRRITLSAVVNRARWRCCFSCVHSPLGQHFSFSREPVLNITARDATAFAVLEIRSQLDLIPQGVVGVLDFGFVVHVVPASP
jgi:hypothetical protein